MLIVREFGVRWRLLSALAVLPIIGLLGDARPAAAGKAVIPFAWDLPITFAVPAVPENNPMSYEKIELGRFLFHDKRLSGNQTFSCASCHEQSLAFTDGLARSVGSTGETHPRSAMALGNIAYAPTLTWANNILEELEEQALVPMFGEFPVELGLAGREEEMLSRFVAVPLYRRMFAEAFPDEEDPVTLASIVRAIGSYQRVLISGTAPWDKYLLGDDDAISESALRGFNLVDDTSGKTECGHCHSGFNFTGSRNENNQPLLEKPFFNTGLYNLRCSDFGLPEVSGTGTGCYPPDNLGLFEVSTRVEHIGRFKPPTLRNVCVTAPYMHDGSVETLDDVLDHYAAGGRTIESGPFSGDGSISPLKTGFLVGFSLTEQEREDIKAFLCALTDEEFLSDASIGDPFIPAACPGDCDYNGVVNVNEVVRQVNINLDTGTMALCVAADGNLSGDVEVNEIIRSVNASLSGCPAQ